MDTTCMLTRPITGHCHLVESVDGRFWTIIIIIINSLYYHYTAGQRPHSTPSNFPFIYFFFGLKFNKKLMWYGS